MSKVTLSELRDYRQFGYFNDEAPTLTGLNNGVPAGILTSLTNEILEVITAERSGDLALGGSRKVLDWEDNEYILPMIENTGATTPYSDFGSTDVSGANPTFNKYGHYRFSSKWNYGSLEARQYAKARMDYPSIVANSTMEALRIEENRVAFNGYINNTSGDMLCYGLFNNPALGNYVPAGKTFTAMDALEINTFFATLYSDLATSSGGHITQQSKVRVVLSTTANAQLVSKVTSLGIKILDELKSVYTGLELVPAVECNGANAGVDVLYAIAEVTAGGITKTTELGFSERFLAGNLVINDNSQSQVLSTGTAGALIYKPFAIKRYTGV